LDFKLLKMSLKTIAKKTLKLLHNHKKYKNDIFIFTLPRAGSTFLAEILNTNKECKTCAEPFALNKDNKEVLKKYLLNETLKERYTDISQNKFKLFLKYLKDLSAGKTWNSFYWSDFFSKDHSFKTIRTIFKIHKLTYLFDDIMPFFSDEKAIYLLRHPVSHSLSRIRNNWTTYNELYMSAEKIKHKLSDKKIDAASEIINNGSKLQKFVLSWILENYSFLMLYKANKLPQNVIPVFYETLLSDSEKYLKDICLKINLEFSEEMLKKIHVPSHGIVHSTQEIKQKILLKDTNALLSGWQNKISDKDKNEISELLNIFEIEIYNIESVLPIL